MMYKKNKALDTLIQELHGALSFRQTKVNVESLEALIETEKEISVGISGNVSVDALGMYLKKHAIVNGIGVNVEIGSYDDPLNDASSFEKKSTDFIIHVILFDNIQPGLESKVELISDDDLLMIEENFLKRTDLFCRTTQNVSNLFITMLHATGANFKNGQQSKVEKCIRRLNEKLIEIASNYKHVQLIDTQEIIFELGRSQWLDARFYFQNTAPYRPAFLDALANEIWLSSRGFNSYFFKALVLDCDNTLWGGVIGEDLLTGIKIDKFEYPGNIFWQAQNIFSALEKNGVIICLASKNNLADVDEVLQHHPQQVLRDEQIALKKINWSDKVKNLKELSEALNIGLDSFVFLDDSDFECENMRHHLPMVRTLQVPKSLSDYPKVLKTLGDLFVKGRSSEASAPKTKQYQQLFQAAEAAKDFDNNDDYLKSLNISIQVAKDDANSIDRISELSLKSNQFNLTTLRQTPVEIKAKIENPDFTVYSVKVSDKFGDSGLTAIVIAAHQDDESKIEAFIMSCRIIGRGIETAIFTAVLNDLKQRGFCWVSAKFSATEKNSQVASFYSDLGMRLTHDSSTTKDYRDLIADLTIPSPKHIEIK